MQTIKTVVRSLMHTLAKALNSLSRGTLTPTSITLAGLAAHIPIAYLVASDYLFVSGILLIIFGLFDTLDGELARLQKSTSASGMFLDSFTDRIKEVVLYVGIGWWTIYFTDSPYLAVLALACVGVSILISYLNAWGEAVLSTQSDTAHPVNKTFRGGVLGFEVRMFLLVVGFLFSQIPYVLAIILVLGIITILTRLANILGRLSSV